MTLKGSIKSLVRLIADFINNIDPKPPCRAHRKR